MTDQDPELTSARVTQWQQEVLLSSEVIIPHTGFLVFPSVSSSTHTIKLTLKRLK